uniref:Uncharacterized protein n=1 Tax=Glossina austeni TaxID=7395 RepID=A0A1A9UJL7_GLOAU
MYPGSEFNSQGVALVNSSGQSFQPTNGGELMSNDSNQTPAIRSNTRPTVIKFFDSAEEFRKFKYVAASELMRHLTSGKPNPSLSCYIPFDLLPSTDPLNFFTAFWQFLAEFSEMFSKELIITIRNLIGCNFLSVAVSYVVFYFKTHNNEVQAERKLTGRTSA